MIKILKNVEISTRLVSIVVILLFYSLSFSFDQTTISDMLLWLSSDTGVTFAVGSPHPVSLWEDISGNGHDFENAVGADSPEYNENGCSSWGCNTCGTPAIKFSWDWLDCVDHDWLGGLDGITVFIRVFNDTSLGAYQAAFAMQDSTTSAAMLGVFVVQKNSPSLGLRRNTGDSWDGFDFTDAVLNDSDMVISYRHDYTSSKTVIKAYDFITTVKDSDLSNGTSGTSSTGTQNMRIGTSQWASGSDRFFGNIDVIMVYGRYLSEAEEDVVMAYLDGCGPAEPRIIPEDKMCDTLTY